ncbi:MAG: TetR/AcrR family transcriptional regulator [Spirochaetes bacterium]|uniref:TetR/AcrR family transcriptional regulator n=1 Tax=Candidatus Gallitreponema excrementavium TaxID=2840840 RepID=A0A9D9HNR5_9SPIR|nr:TetR/AcrR family transcriptional regulator [Candidatus Gallitreponema excrementavium]
MAIIVEHEKRRHEILDKALEVFVDEGYEDATFQKIADKCGITRTTLYIYFKNKKEIFLWSIKQLTEKLEKNILKLMEDRDKSCKERLLDMLYLIIDECAANKALFEVILSYLIQISKTGKDPNSRVKRRTIRMRHLISQLLIEGEDKGEFKKLNLKTANDMLYSYVESAIFRLAVLGSGDVSDIKKVAELSVDSFLK